MKSGNFGRLANLRLPNATDGAETLLEFVDAAFGVHELLLTREERMGISSDTSGNHAVFHAVDHFLLFGRLGGAGDETRASGHIYEDDRVVFRMNFLFHEIWGSHPRFRRSGMRTVEKTLPLSSHHPRRILNFTILNSCKLSRTPFDQSGFFESLL